MFVETLGLAGINLPVWVFRILLVIIVIIGLGVFYKKYLKDKIKVIKRVKDDISNDAVGEIKKKTEENVKILEQKIQAVQDGSDEGDKKLGEQIELINGKVDKIADSIDALAGAINDIQTQMNQEEIAKAKDRLLELYKYYTDPARNGEWTEFEAEAFWARFDTYSNAGGNSYLHNYVEPEMRKLKVIKIN